MDSTGFTGWIEIHRFTGFTGFTGYTGYTGYTRFKDP
jgi:hypothetical protein